MAGLNDEGSGSTVVGRDDDVNRGPARSDRAELALRAAQRSENNAYLVRQLHRSFLRLLTARLAPHGVTPAQWSVLRELWRRDGDSQVELAQAVGVEKATLTSVLDALERRELIKQVRSTEDRRRFAVNLTKSGRALEKDLLPYADEINAVAMAGLADKDVRLFRSVILQMIDNLR